MKSILIKTTLTLVILSFTSCSNKESLSPSANTTLNSVSPDANKKNGAMQKNLDSWLKDEWTPVVEKKQEKSTKEEKNFTLQEYVDKAAVYMDSLPKNNGSSNVEKLNKLPVIGE